MTRLCPWHSLTAFSFLYARMKTVFNKLHYSTSLRNMLIIDKLIKLLMVILLYIIYILCSQVVEGPLLYILHGCCTSTSKASTFRSDAWPQARQYNWSDASLIRAYPLHSRWGMTKWPTWWTQPFPRPFLEPLIPCDTFITSWVLIQNTLKAGHQFPIKHPLDCSWGAAFRATRRFQCPGNTNLHFSLSDTANQRKNKHLHKAWFFYALEPTDQLQNWVTAPLLQPTPNTYIQTRNTCQLVLSHL